jgi:CBS domain-containing protein
MPMYTWHEFDREITMKVSELMTKEPISCRPSDTVRRVAQMMRDHGLVLIPVVNEAQQLGGVITDRDLCCRFIVVGSVPEQETIQQYMSIDPITCHSDDEIGGCEQLMRKHGIHRIPVVDEDARCVGIVCPTDLLEKPETLVSRELIRGLRTTLAKHDL